MAGAYKYVLAVNEQSMLSVKELSHLDYGNINHTTSHEAAVGGAQCVWAGLLMMLPFMTRKKTGH